MAKYRMVRQGLQRKLGTGPATFEVSPLVSYDDLVLTHEPSYVHRFLNNELTPLENRKVGVSCGTYYDASLRCSVVVCLWCTIYCELSNTQRMYAHMLLAQFPWSAGSVNRTLSSIGGTVAAMHAVCTSPSSKQSQFTLFAGHIAGGTHHAFYDRYTALHQLDTALHQLDTALIPCIVYNAAPP
jgi:acetoin utilization deacetylase AcuC-like enzyme